MIENILSVGLVVCLLFLYLMFIRIRQLTNELNMMKNKMELTDEELNQLVSAIEDFKQLKIA